MMTVKKAIINIMENNLAEMKQNIEAAITEKVVQKLDEKKIEIGREYFIGK